MKRRKHDVNKIDIFIAYADEDIIVAEAIFGRLSAHATVFFAKKSIPAGRDWDEALQEAQLSALITVVLVSPHTRRAYYQRAEVAAALSRAHEPNSVHKVVPVFLGKRSSDDDTLPYGLNLKQGLPLPSLEDAGAVCQEILLVLNTIKNGTIFRPRATRESDHLEPPREIMAALVESELPRLLALLELDPSAVLIRCSLSNSFVGSLVRSRRNIDHWTQICHELSIRGLAGVAPLLRMIDEIQNTIYSVDISKWAARYLRALLDENGGGGRENIGAHVARFCRMEKERWSRMEEEAERLADDRNSPLEHDLKQFVNCWKAVEEFLVTYALTIDGSHHRTEHDSGETLSAKIVADSKWS